MDIQKIMTALVLLMCLSACNTLKPSDDPYTQISIDPYENLNRRIHNFNLAADKAVLKPVAIGYQSVTPKPVRKSISNFFQNLSEPLDAVNNVLQGKFDRSLISSYRFIVNSTLGIAGLFDVVQHFYGVKPAREDFGQTLAAWGAKPGPYLVLPFFGPTNLRDGFGLTAERLAYLPNEIVTDSTSARAGLTVLNIVDLRSDFIGFREPITNQTDPYLFLKGAFEEMRLNQLYDGSPPDIREVDFDDF